MVYNNSHAADPRYVEAFKKLQEAIIKTAPIKAIRVKAEQYIKLQIDPPAWATTAAAVGISAIKDKKISTRKFKNLRLRGGEENPWILRPNIDYQFNSGDTAGSLNFILAY